VSRLHFCRCCGHGCRPTCWRLSCSIRARSGRWASWPRASSPRSHQPSVRSRVRKGQASSPPGESGNARLVTAAPSPLTGPLTELLLRSFGPRQVLAEELAVVW